MTTLRRLLSGAAVVTTAVALSVTPMAIRASADSPPPTCFGRPATIVGTDGPDVITGTSGPDVIVGLGGDDTIDGVSGGDFVCGGSGNDTVVHAAFVHGGSGEDVIHGGVGLDQLYGDGGADHLYGGKGNDLLDGGSGKDVVKGGHGSDQIFDGSGNDVVHGGRGGDTFEVGGGDDHLHGNKGSDEAQYESNPAGVHVDLASGKATDGYGGHDHLAGIAVVSGTPFADKLLGSDGPNTLIGNGGADVIHGRGGDDILSEVAPSASTISGGKGEDRLDPEMKSANIHYPDGVVVDLAAGTMKARFGPKRESALSGIEDVQGTDGKDILRGDSKPNVLEGYLRADELDGKGGNDHLVGGFHDYTDGSEPGDRDTADGGAGNDVCKAHTTVHCER
jgi:Ca2+-binding RTX toxin-like protein